MAKSKKVARKDETKKAQSPETEAPAVHEPVAAAPKAQREERNGVKRPGPGKCLEVWEYLDKNGDMKPADMKPIAVEKNWNQNNALIELYQWRRFNGVARAATK